MDKQINKLYIVIAALVIVIIGLIFYKQESVEQVMAQSDKNPVIENILNRKSVRSYLTKDVSPEILEELVRAGMAAPSARNCQPWEFIIVDDKEILAQYVDVTPGASMAGSAPAAIVVMGNLDVYEDAPTAKGYWPQDTAAATQNILLAAESMGLGAVWTGLYSENSESSMERVRKAKALFNLGDNLMPLGVVVLGYPKGDTKPKDKWDAKKIHWNKVK